MSRTVQYRPSPRIARKLRPTRPWVSSGGPRSSRVKDTTQTPRKERAKGSTRKNEREREDCRRGTREKERMENLHY